MITPLRQAIMDAIRAGEDMRVRELKGIWYKDQGVRAYCRVLVKAGVLILVEKDLYRAGPEAREWLDTPPKTKGGGTSRWYYLRKRWRAKQAGEYHGLRRQAHA